MPASRTRSDLLCQLLSGSWRSHPPPATLSAAELEAIAPLLHGSGAAGLAWRSVRDSTLACLPSADGLRQAYRLQVLRNSIREKEIHEIFMLLRSTGIDAILVKGWAAARSYPECGLRPYGDIDLVVLPAQRAAAVELLAGRELVDFEHEELDKGREIETLFERSQQIDGIRFLGPEDHLWMISSHFLKHGGWRPLWLCDIAAALEAQPGGFDWDRCLGTNKTQARGIECCATLAHHLLGARVEHTIGLPAWFAPAVRRQWENAHYQKHQLPKPIADSLWDLPDSLRRRWPDPITATTLTGGPFNEAPRVIFQFAYYGVLLRKYLRRLGG